MKHFTHIADLGPEGVQEVLDQAVAWKANAPGHHLAGRILGMVFFNPSLRTRTSFEAAMIRGGGNAIVLEVGNGVWRLESRDGVIMDGDLTEHLREAVPVLGRYTDFLAVRAFSDGGGLAADDADHVINAFRRFAGVPVISMESAREHPCQGLADMLTVRENFGDLQDLPVTLTWAPHIKRLPRAVPNSFLLTALASGCDVRVVHPEGLTSRRASWSRQTNMPGRRAVKCPFYEIVPKPPPEAKFFTPRRGDPPTEPPRCALKTG